MEKKLCAVALTCSEGRNLTLFSALTGRAFDRLKWQHSGEFDQNFFQKSNAPVFALGGGGEGGSFFLLRG